MLPRNSAALQRSQVERVTLKGVKTTFTQAAAL
jgi:hypothetical protein